MCTLVILRRPDHDWPLLLAANRIAGFVAHRAWRHLRRRHLFLWCVVQLQLGFPLTTPLLTVSSTGAAGSLMLPENLRWHPKPTCGSSWP